MSTVSTERPDDADAPAGAPVIELRGITKRFPGVVANSDVNLTVGRGEVHAVVGENGAGKSTLMKTLYGMHQPDEGTILLEGRPVVFKTPTAAIAAGIGMVHQHFMLADNFTVLENIILGSEPERGRPDRLRGRPRQGAADLRQLRPRPAPRPADRAPLGRRPAAGGDRQGALPRCPGPDPRRADRRAGPAGGGRALRQPRRPAGRGAVGHLHLAQARRGAQGRRPDHRHPARHDRRHGRPQGGDGPAARRDDGRQRAARARDP